MLQLVAMVICGYLGWQRSPFQRWPLAIIVFATIAGCALVISAHHAGAGPDLDVKLLRGTVSMVVFPAVVYAVTFGIRRVLDRRAQK